MKYVDALQKRKPVKEIPPGMTHEYVVQAIADITEQLKRPMPNVERVLFVHDRADFRDILALMDARP